MFDREDLSILCNFKRDGDTPLKMPSKIFKKWRYFEPSRSAADVKCLYLRWLWILCVLISLRENVFHGQLSAPTTRKEQRKALKRLLRMFRRRASQNEGIEHLRPATIWTSSHKVCMCTAHTWAVVSLRPMPRNSEAPLKANSRQKKGSTAAVAKKRYAKFSNMISSSCNFKLETWSTNMP